MKIAIYGHASRGPEVIKILESLGGNNTAALNGRSKAFYHINEGEICNHDYLPKDCKAYTLEEFEKEFPFKIGDKVTVLTDTIYKVVALEYYMSELHYKLDNGLHYSSNLLTLYKEMKEERNITLTLNKAKEWYRKGGELKEVALQAYSEEELTRVELPKTWEEFCNNSLIRNGMYYIDVNSDINFCKKNFVDKKADKNLCPSQKSAEAHLAMIQLEQLRDCWLNGWTPIWDRSEKWCIRLWGNALSIGVTTYISRFLTFPTKEMAEEFLKCFRDLIILAKDLI